MAQTVDSPEPRPAREPRRRWLRLRWRVLLLLLTAVAVIAWVGREDIAETLITDYFAEQGITASYTVEEVGPQNQVLTDIVIGDPARPDLTIERLELTLTPRLGLPALTRLEVIGPRLYGSYLDGKLSFGSLDPLIFTGSEEPFEFPDLELVVRDGRGRIASDAGPMGLTLSGGGHLRGGFAAEVALLAPQFASGGCMAQQASLYGQLGIDAERPVFNGPLRFAALECAGLGLSLGESTAQMDLRADRNLTDFEGKARFTTGAAALAGNRLASLGGEGSFNWRDGALQARYDLAARDMATSVAAIGELALVGDIRADGIGAEKGFANIAVTGEVSGAGIVPGSFVLDSLGSAQEAAQGTLAEPLLAKFRRALAAETRRSSFSASFNARSDRSDDTGSVSDGDSGSDKGQALALVLPEARWQGSSGQTLLALSRVQISTNGHGLPLFDGNFVTGGVDMPRISGRMEQGAGGALTLQMAMAPYRAADAQLTVPRLSINQRRSNRGRGEQITLAGLMTASGAIPGGQVEGLTVPLDAVISANGTLAMWEGCRRIGFDRLTLAALSLGKQTLGLCPTGAGPMLRYGKDGVRFAASTARLDLMADYGGSPLSITSGPLRIAYPGTITAPDLSIALGTGAQAIRFSASEIMADIAGGAVSGRFAGAEAFLPAIPLNLTKASGAWNFADSVFRIEEGAFTVTDRQTPARFNPLVSQGAQLTLNDGLIAANAVMRAPFTNAEVVQVAIIHDLAKATGYADLAVRGLVFSDELQPQDLTERARGIVANVEGMVTGSGRIDWNPQNITSTGAFSSDGIDFAAAFGPVKGASGTIRFTDLLGLTTAPNQRFKLAAINPGIEVNDGEVGISIEGGTLVRFEGGRWPLLGGTMVMRPVNINVGAIEERTYLIEITGMQASRFIEQMELNNLAATGTFDGTIPVIFDADGNGRLEGGILVSRAPGGNLAYVGDLTYEDLGTFTNYAFSALRDLRFNRMEVLMDGPLTGELVTKVRFDGIGQGETAVSNIITRQIARLPIELRINIRAPFYQLISSTRSLYDPSAVRDPRSLGLLRGEAGRFVPATVPTTPRDNEPRNEPEIQPSESESGL